MKPGKWLISHSAPLITQCVPVSLVVAQWLGSWKYQRWWLVGYWILHHLKLFSHSLSLWLASLVELVVKNLPANAGDVRDVGLIPGSGRSPGGSSGNPLQYSFLENPMDRRASWVTVHWVTKSWTWLKWLSTHAFLWHLASHLVFLCLSFSCMNYDDWRGIFIS